MDIRLLETVEELELICNSCHDGIITCGYTSDLMSDVLAHAEEDSVLITIQAHKNSVAVSSIAGANAIIICNNRPIDDDMIQAAEEAEIALFRTKLNQFETSLLMGKLLAEE